MMFKKSSPKTVCDLAKALGLNADRLPITDIAIKTSCGWVPTVTVTMNVHQEQLQELVKILQRDILSVIDGEATEESR